MIGNKARLERNSCTISTTISLLLFLFFTSYSTCLKAMLSSEQKKSLNTIGQIILNQYPRDKNSLFVAPPGFFIFSPSKREFVECIQNNQQPVQANNTQTYSKKLSGDNNSEIK